MECSPYWSKWWLAKHRSHPYSSLQAVPQGRMTGLKFLIKPRGQNDRVPDVVKVMLRNRPRGKATPPFRR